MLSLFNDLVIPPEYVYCPLRIRAEGPIWQTTQIAPGVASFVRLSLGERSKAARDTLA